MSSNKLSKQNLQTEVDAAWLYQKLAENESDETVAYIFRQMSEIESGHAHAFLAKQANQSLPHPSFRAKALNTIGKVFGYDYVLGVLMDTEKGIANALIAGKIKSNVPVSGTETTHVAILRSLAENASNVSGSDWHNLRSGIGLWVEMPFAQRFWAAMMAWFPISAW
jgi:hypothetical protein